MQSRWAGSHKAGVDAGRPRDHLRLRTRQKTAESQHHLDQHLHELDNRAYNHPLPLAGTLAVARLEPRPAKPAVPERAIPMAIRFLCPSCRVKLSIADRKAGTVVECPKCQARVKVPDDETTAMDGIPVKEEHTSTSGENDSEFGESEAEAYDSVDEESQTSFTYRPRKRKSNLTMGIWVGVSMVVFLGLCLAIYGWAVSHVDEKKQDTHPPVATKPQRPQPQKPQRQEPVFAPPAREVDDRQNDSTNYVGAIFVLLVCLFVYFVPTYVAFFRGHHQRFAILMLNIFTAWTCIAWAAALVWSFTKIDTGEHIHHHYHHDRP